MILAGLQKNTLIDYPKKLACIIFTLGCNFRCNYCYNSSLVIHDKYPKKLIKEEEFFEFLKKRKKLLEAVVISGGEPTLHKDLNLFIKKIKDLGFLVKLDTQGSNPNFLKEILKEGNVDYIAMDIKGPLYKYSKIINKDIEKNLILESIKIIFSYAEENKNFDYEFRSTVVEGDLVEKDFEEIGKMIKGSKKYFLQKFVAEKDLNNPEYKNKKAYSDQKMKEFQKIMEKYVDEVKIR